MFNLVDVTELQYKQNLEAWIISYVKFSKLIRENSNTKICNEDIWVNSNEAKDT